MGPERCSSHRCVPPLAGVLPDAGHLSVRLPFRVQPRLVARRLQDKLPRQAFRRREQLRQLHILMDARAEMLAHDGARGRAGLVSPQPLAPHREAVADDDADDEANDHGFFAFPQRAAAASCAIFRRCAFVSAFARAIPPRRAISRTFMRHSIYAC